MVKYQGSVVDTAAEGDCLSDGASKSPLEKLAARISSHADGDLLFVSDLAANARKALLDKPQTGGDAPGVSDESVKIWCEKELDPDAEVAPTMGRGYSNRWASYVNRKFTKEWYSPDRASTWRLITRMLALIIHQEEAQPLYRIAVAAGDQDFGCDRSIALLRKMRTYLSAGAIADAIESREPLPKGAHNGDPNASEHEDGSTSTDSPRSQLEILAAETAVSFKHAAIKRWMKNSDALKNYVAEHVGHRLWADYATYLVRAGVLRGRGIEYIFDYGLDHLEAVVKGELDDAAYHTGDTLSLEPLKALIEVHGALGEALKKVEDLDNSHQFKLQAPRRCADAFSLVEQFRVKMPHLTPSALKPHTNALLTMVEFGADEIPALYPSLRILGDNGWEGPNISSHKMLTQIVYNDQLVARYTAGRANADAYHNGTDETRDAIRSIVDAWAEEVDQFTDSEPDLTDDEVDKLDAVAYLFKFLWCGCTVAEPDDWLNKARELRAAKFANHPFASIRMAFGESLIERCCDASNRLRPKPDDPWDFELHGHDNLFYRPIWDYHCVDLAEAFGTWNYRVHNNATLTTDDQAPCLQRVVELGAKVQSRLSNVELDLDKLREPGKSKWSFVPRELTAAAKAYWQTEKLLRELESIQISSPAFVEGEAKDATERLNEWLRPFACHPVWEVTEAVASKLAKLREFENAARSRTNIAEGVILRWGLPNSDLNQAHSCWQLCYAACDAAYNSMNVDSVAVDSVALNQTLKRDSSLFTQLVDANYNEREWSRIQFICSEDTFLWFTKLKEAREDARLNADIANAERDLWRWWKTTRKWLVYWFGHANDSAQLYDLFQWAQSLVQDLPESDDKNKGKTWRAIPRIRRRAKRLLEDAGTVRYLRNPYYDEDKKFMTKAQWLMKYHALRVADVESKGFCKMWDWEFTSHS